MVIACQPAHGGDDKINPFPGERVHIQILVGSVMRISQLVSNLKSVFPTVLSTERQLLLQANPYPGKAIVMDSDYGFGPDRFKLFFWPSSLLATGRFRPDL